jgi:plastocyanin
MHKARLHLRSVLVVAAVLSLSARFLGAATVEVEMRDNYFSPSSLTIALGDTVTWINRGAHQHNTVSRDLGLWESDL